jgi:hypothetical protein
MTLQEKNPHLLERELKKSIEAIKNGTIDDVIILKVIDKMYADDDKFKIMDKLEDQFEYRKAILYEGHMQQM